MSQNIDNNRTLSGVEPEELLEPRTIDMVEPEPDPEQISSVISRMENGEVDGDRFYSRMIGRYKILTREETLDLARKVSEGDSGAKEKLILHNLRLVPFFANSYRGCLDWNDLIQEGNLGLMRAAEKFDYRFGCTFPTYAKWWIKQSIGRAIDNQSGPVRLPVKRRELKRAINRIIAELSNELGHVPTIDEISARSGHDRLTVYELIKGTNLEAFSLDAQVDGKDGNKVAHSEFFPDRNCIRPDTRICALEELSTLVEQAVNLLSAINSLLCVESRNRDMFKCFYGLDGSIDAYNTLELTAQKFQLNRERVRQIMEEVWICLKENYPGLALNHDRLLSLYTRIEILEDATGTKISVGNLLEAANLERNSKETALTQETKRRRKRRTTHIRATSAFIHWLPDPSNTDPCMDAIRLVGAAYEISAQIILGSKTSKQVKWARNLAMYIILNDLNQPSHVISSMFGTTERLLAVSSACKHIDSVLESDQRVKADVEKIRSHFKKMKGL